ncbi:hypothetical protein [Ktedonobacter robiniae]|uniref:Uncharacterized protein n=1 Tax=Ktedonobacter robiniae TaxID=2778365 RepID=A0ABQ3UZN9_9CHLR|nr:hypothetical protein [Ktedonobacter robiniae]GHO58186.1 hypothetical protein KSB_66610 [Ktedonobacter robiniae]
MMSCSQTMSFASGASATTFRQQQKRPLLAFAPLSLPEKYKVGPPRIQLHYHARSGRKSSPWHTPDFLVICRDSVAFEE